MVPGHWPVLLLGAQLIDTDSGWNRLLLVVVSLLIAALSYRFFETPIRHYRKLLAKPRMAVFVGLAIVVLAGSFALRWHNAAQARMKQPAQLRFAAAHFDAPVIYGMGCDDWYHSASVKVCTFGDPHAVHTAVAVGDSVGLQWFPAYARLFDKPGWRLLVVTKSSCPMVDVPIFYPRIGRKYTECAMWRKAALREIAAMHPDIVVMGSTFTYDYTQKQWTDGTQRVLDELAPAAGRVYIMRSSPTLPFDGPACVAPRSGLYAALKGNALCTTPARTVHSDAVFSWLRAAADDFPNVQLIDMTGAICPHDTCRAETNGEIVFRDDRHMTATFAGSLAPALAHAMDLPLPAAPARASAHRQTP